MNDHLISLILGIVEGVTEFLPVSSTAHLRLMENMLHISLDDGYWKMFSIVIQLGAVLCLPIYFRERIFFFLKNFLTSKNKLRHPLSLVTISFVVTAVPSFLLAKVIGKNLESLHIMGYALLLGGIIMWLVDGSKAAWEKSGRGAKGTPITTWTMDDMTMRQAAVIGLCQVAAAVLPGTSRSMATIAGGQMMGLSRAAALEFSFFLSMPTMAAATLFVLIKSLIGGPDVTALGAEYISAHQWGVLGVGFVVSFIVAYASVAFLMHWVRSRGFVPFAIYRILLGALLLALPLGGL